jgi:ribosomal protein S2
MAKVTFDELLDAGVHFGHLSRKWNPNMAPYIFGEKKGIHIPTLDSQLAATAQRHGLIMVTRNTADFKNAGVKLLNPFVP